MKQQQNNPIVQVQTKAYKKINYHCLRYSSSTVYGVLVGQSPSKITDAYPLFHSPIVNPSFNIALNLIQSNLDEHVSIQGFYQFFDSGQLLLSRIKQGNQQMKNLHLMRVWCDPEKIIRLGITNNKVQTCDFKEVMQGVKQGKHRFIVDMDAHFEDVQLDFRNTYVN